MNLSCPNCQTNYRIADERIPATGARANCPNCGQNILIPGAGGELESSGLLSDSSGADYGQTMAFDYSEVDQSRTEITALLEKISSREPFIGPGLVLALKEQESGREHVLTVPETALGRSGTGLIIDDPEVSRRHCLIKVFGDRVVVIDLESTNGTYVHGKKVMTASLGVSETFTIGNTTFELISKQEN